MFLEDKELDEWDEAREREDEDKFEEPEEGYLEEEETLEELDVDDRGHVRPRRPRQDEPEY